MNKEETLKQFQMDVAKFSGNYTSFLIIANTSDSLMWKSTDDTWGVGAAKRYVDSISERDRQEERTHLEE